MSLFVHLGQPLHYLVRGTGEPVLLIHGIGSSAADWAFQVPPLESRFQVILPDLPGCGHSALPRSGFGVPAMACAMWALLDELGIGAPNIVGFSLGGAVALEMALQRPSHVPRMVLINSLASYRLDHWKKWLEAAVPPVMVRLLGMRRVARMIARRVFPEPWQQPMRDRAVRVIGAVPARVYLGLCRGLIGWSAMERLENLRSRVLIIAAEHDYTPLAEKHDLAARLQSPIVVVRGSRHGTPFDSVTVTNASVLAHLADEPLPALERWLRDSPSEAPDGPPPGSIADEHAAGPH